MKTLQSERPGQMCCRLLSDHGFQPILLYPVNLSITIDGENEMFHDKAKFKQHSIYKSSPIKVPEGTCSKLQDYGLLGVFGYLET